MSDNAPYRIERRAAIVDHSAAVVPRPGDFAPPPAAMASDDADRVREALAVRYAPADGARLPGGLVRLGDVGARPGPRAVPGRAGRRRRVPGGAGGRGPPRRHAAHRPAAIRAVHVSRGDSDPTAAAVVRGALAGLRRQVGVAAAQAASLTADALAAIVATSPATPAGRRDVALARTMRDGLLRRAEAAVLTWGEVTAVADGSARLLIRRSKTDPEAAGATLYVSPPTRTALEAIRPPAVGGADLVFGLGKRQIGRRIAAMARRAGWPTRSRGTRRASAWPRTWPTPTWNCPPSWSPAAGPVPTCAPSTRGARPLAAAPWRATTAAAAKSAIVVPFLLWWAYTYCTANFPLGGHSPRPAWSSAQRSLGLRLLADARRYRGDQRRHSG